MPAELAYLVGSGALVLVYVLGEVVCGNLQYSMRDLLGARDSLPAYNVAMGRAKRATANMVEAVAMFAPLILAAVLTDRTNDMTALGAAIFFWARLAYAPAYWFGIPVLRTLIWFAGLAGVILVLLQVLPF